MKDKKATLVKVNRLVAAYKKGLLGGEKMPEDENPHLEKSSRENYMYFTLPMALNYQRNSYTLWECANRMFQDEKAGRVFNSKFVDRENITVAPDTHVIQASTRLGIISEIEMEQSNVQALLAERWNELLKGTEFVPIDVHTPMWLWSRGKFKVEI